MIFLQNIELTLNLEKYLKKKINKCCSNRSLSKRILSLVLRSPENWESLRTDQRKLWVVGKTSLYALGTFFFLNRVMSYIPVTRLSTVL